MAIELNRPNRKNKLLDQNLEMRQAIANAYMWIQKLVADDLHKNKHLTPDHQLWCPIMLWHLMKDVVNQRCQTNARSIIDLETENKSLRIICLKSLDWIQHYMNTDAHKKTVNPVHCETTCSRLVLISYEVLPY